MVNHTLFYKKTQSRAFFIFFLILYKCTPNVEQPYSFTQFAMDTNIDYTIIASNREVARHVMLKAQKEIRRIEQLFWEHDSSSEIFRFNHSTEGIKTTQEVFGLVNRALEYNQITGGSFNITLKPVLDLYPFFSNNPVPPTDKLVNKTMRYVGGITPDSFCSLKKSVKVVSITTGGFVKGYAVDQAIIVIQEQNIKNALISAGGDIYCLGINNNKPWRVGIQHPRKEEKLLKVLSLSDQAVATSGDYQRYFIYNGKRYHQILDPSTGKPANRTQSSTVIAPTTEEADIWATALFVMGSEEGIRMINHQENIYGSLVDSSGTIFYSNGFRNFVIE